MEKEQLSNTVKQFSPEYQSTLDEIDKISNLSQEEQGKYINERIKKLSDTAEKGEMSTRGKKVCNGFVGPDMLIRRNILVDPIVLDDPSLYQTMFETLKMFRGVEHMKDKTLRQLHIGLIQWTISKYFGNEIPYKETETENRNFYMERSGADSPEISISELKGKGFAVCAEKSSVAENLLVFSGLEAKLVVSTECRIPEEAEESGHYYNIILGPTQKFIYDPSNPKLVTNSNGKLINYNPAMYRISDEDYEKLMNGGAVTVVHVDTEVSDGIEKNIESRRVYGGVK
ncbi:MAG: hypothetical protein WCF94_00310 [bacterium]